MTVITVLLRKINIPQHEIDTLVENIDERGISEMISIENYDVQETRREARAEALAEAAEEITQTRLLLKSAVKLLLDQGNTISDVATQMNISEYDIAALVPELT